MQSFTGVFSPTKDLEKNTCAATEDKYEIMRVLYARWKHEDEEDKIVDETTLRAHQHTRIKEIGFIVFGFTLREEQIDAIWTLYSEQKDHLLLAKTGFGKSLIFQLLPFMYSETGVALILMPLKLLQAEQCAMVNGLSGGQGIVLNSENNTKRIRSSIGKGRYTHVFTSPEIAVSIDFKKNVLDNHTFRDRLCLLAIDEIHLVDK